MTEVSLLRLYLLRAMYLLGYVFAHYVKKSGDRWQVSLGNAARGGAR